MKLLERTDSRMVFGLGPREKVLFERLLAFYPLVPNPQPTVSRLHGPDFAEAASLLHEAQRELRTELEEWIKRRLEEGGALAHQNNQWKLTLEGSEQDRLMQVLNELRVGAWTKLGCPDDLHEEELANTPSLAPLYLIMTVAGQFLISLIQALMGNPDEPTLPDEPMEE